MRKRGQLAWVWPLGGWEGGVVDAPLEVSFPKVREQGVYPASLPARYSAALGLPAGRGAMVLLAAVVLPLSEAEVMLAHQSLQQHDPHQGREGVSIRCGGPASQWSSWPMATFSRCHGMQQ